MCIGKRGLNKYLDKVNVTHGSRDSTKHIVHTRFFAVSLPNRRKKILHIHLRWKSYSGLSWSFPGQPPHPAPRPRRPRAQWTHPGACRWFSATPINVRFSTPMLARLPCSRCLSNGMFFVFLPTRTANSGASYHKTAALLIHCCFRFLEIIFRTHALYARQTLACKMLMHYKCMHLRCRVGIFSIV